MDHPQGILLADLFPSAVAASTSEGMLHYGHMHKNTAAQIAHHLGLDFIDQETPERSNVCLANAEHVRPEYRTDVTAREIFWYVVAVREAGLSDRVRLPYPISAEAFWAMVERGNSLTASGTSSACNRQP